MRNPKRISHYMTTCSKNLFKHFKFCYQTKINGEKLQHVFQFFMNLMIFSFKKKVIKYLCKKQIQEKKTCQVFECFQSHCHILKKLHEFLNMMSAIFIFEKNSFIFSFVGYGLITKSLEARCRFEKVTEKTKCQKMNVKFLQQN
jgi:hypothetical protein